jgi:hypothetical protein
MDWHTFDDPIPVPDGRVLKGVADRKRPEANVTASTCGKIARRLSGLMNP